MPDENDLRPDPEQVIKDNRDANALPDAAKDQLSRTDVPADASEGAAQQAAIIAEKEQMSRDAAEKARTAHYEDADAEQLEMFDDDDDDNTD